MPTLRPYQAEPMRHILDSVRNRRGLTFDIMMSRQAGKNELSAQLEVLLLTMHWATGGNLIKASPTFKPQTITSMMRLRERLDQAGYQSHWHSEFGYQVVFGRARALFYSAEPTANVVGATAHVLLEVDEAQDVDQDKYSKDFRPMGSTTNVTTVMYGTAWSDDTLLERQRQLNTELQRRDGIRRHFEYPWEEVARFNPSYRAYVEAERERLGADHPLFTTQYELKTLSGGGRFLSPQQRAQLAGDHLRYHSAKPDKIYVAGLDLAGEDEEAADAALRSAKPMKDSTVLTIAELEFLEASLPAKEEPPAPPLAGPGHGRQRLARCRIVEHVYHTGIRHHTLIPQLVDVLANVWHVKRVTVDATGIGASIANSLTDVLGSTVVEPYVFTAPSKSQLAFGLLAAINSGGLKMYAGDSGEEQREFWYQMEKAKSTVRANQTMNFFLDPGEGHDDFLMSLALLARAATTYRPRTATGH